MKFYFALLSLCLTSCLAEIQSVPSTNNGQQFAESRDYASTSNSFSDSSFSSSPTVTYSTGHSLYTSDPTFGVNGGFNIGNSANGNFLSNDLISTGLNIVIGLFAISVIIQIVTKVIDTDFFSDIFDARSLTSDDLVTYTNMFMNAVNKFEHMNTPK